MTPADIPRSFIETVFRIFLFINRKAEIVQDRRLKLISLTILNYVREMAKEGDVDLRSLQESFASSESAVDMVPFFAYLEKQQIQLLDLQRATPDSIDVRSKKDLERYVLSQIYYLTQHNLAG